MLGVIGVPSRLGFCLVALSKGHGATRCWFAKEIDARSYWGPLTTRYPVSRPQRNAAYESYESSTSKGGRLL